MLSMGLCLASFESDYGDMNGLRFGKSCSRLQSHEWGKRFYIFSNTCNLHHPIYFQSKKVAQMVVKHL